MKPLSVNHAKRPDICQYLNFREYLRDLFQFNKQRSRVFSYRYIVKKAGCASPSTLTNIINGKRNVSQETAERFAIAFKLSESERRNFLALVAFNQAATLAEREKGYQELLALRADPNSITSLGASQEEYFSHWWHPVLREALMLPDAKNSTLWISRILRPSITPTQVKDSIRLLKRLGLITKEKGTWQAKEKLLATDSQVQSVWAAQFHRQMIQLGMDSIARFQPTDREISGTTLRMAKKDLPRCIALIREFRKKLLGLASMSEEADTVYQFNSQFFPVVANDRPRRIK